MDGYQLIDAEIAGLTGITLQPGQTQTIYKRFVYNEGEDMRYMVVKYYVGGQEQKAYFKLEVGEEAITYESLTNGSRGDAVQSLQERLVELGYLDDTADGIFGANTANAIRAAQEQAHIGLHYLRGESHIMQGHDRAQPLQVPVVAPPVLHGQLYCPA